MASPFAAETTDAVLRLPPGLEPPPGLELPCKPQQMLPPPGLEKKPKSASKPKKNKADASPMYISSNLFPPAVTRTPCPPAVGFTVKISNLPNHLVNKAMMTATLEQARLDTFVSGFATKQGAQHGEALITFTNADAAVKCAQHFNGRRWHASGSPVTARLLPVEPSIAPSIAVPKPSFRLSAEAPEFVPGGAQPLPASVKEPLTISSDVSTADDDSNASSDEKETTA